MEKIINKLANKTCFTFKKYSLSNRSQLMPPFLWKKEPPLSELNALPEKSLTPSGNLFPQTNNASSRTTLSTNSSKTKPITTNGSITLSPHINHEHNTRTTFAISATSSDISVGAAQNITA